MLREPAARPYPRIKRYRGEKRSYLSSWLGIVGITPEVGVLWPRSMAESSWRVYPPFPTSSILSRNAPCANPRTGLPSSPTHRRSIPCTDTVFRTVVHTLPGLSTIHPDLSTSQTAKCAPLAQRSDAPGALSVSTTWERSGGGCWCRMRPHARWPIARGRRDRLVAEPLVEERGADDGKGMGDRVDDATHPVDEG